MKLMKKTAALLMCLMMLSSFVCMTAYAYSNAYRQNARWIESTPTVVNQKYNNGDKFIVDFYKVDCSNSQKIGTNVITPWMNDYGCTVYGIDADTYGITNWGWQAVGNQSVTLPVVCFVDHKKVTAVSNATADSIAALNEAFYTYMNPPAPGKYTLKYNANGASESPEDQTGEGYLSLSTSAPVRSGYTFLGWSTSSSDTVGRYTPGALFNLTSNTTLYAVWKKDSTSAQTYSYPVTYHQTEARSILSKVNALRTGGNAWYWNSDNQTKTVQKNLSALQYDYELEKAAMQRAAEIVCSFSHTRPNDTKVYELFSYNYAGENIAYGYTSADAVQTAWEEANENYDGQGHRRNMLSPNFTAIGIACAEYNGRKYWVQVFRRPTGSTSYTSPNDSLTNVQVQILDKYIAANLVMTSWSTQTLKAGNSAALPSVAQYIAMTESPGNILVNKKTVSWTSSDTSVAKVSGSSVVAVNNGTTILTGTYDGSKTVTIAVTVTGGTTIYTLTYNANGGTGAPPDQTGSSSVTLSWVIPSKTGYSFLGWAKSASAVSPQYSAGATMELTANTTLYAVWRANTYTVNFYGSGSTGGSMNSQTFTFDTAQNLSANAFKRAYTVSYTYNGATGGNGSSTATATATFNGWATMSGGATVYSDKQSVRNLATSGTVNLYANWTLGSVTLPSPTKTGSVFGGWYLDSGLTTYVGAAGAKYTPTSNTSLYAKWTTATLVSVSVKTLPNKTSYVVGDTLDMTGLTLTTTYSDGTAKTITSGFTCSPTTLNTIGSQAITVTYKEGNVTKTTTFTITVGKTLQSISVATKPNQTSYYIGDTLNTAGMIVKATYSGGSTANVTGYTCSPTTLNAAGTQTITVTYKEDGVSKTASFTVTVMTPSINASPNPLNINIGKTGTITYSTLPSGQTVNISVVSVSHTSHTRNGSAITFTGKSKGTDEYDLYMSYNGRQYKNRIEVNVIDPNPSKTLQSISVKTMPDKTSYYIGDTLNTDGLVIKAAYSDGSSANVTGYSCSPTTLNTAGSQTITVTYKEGGVTKTASFTVTVNTPSVNAEPDPLNIEVGKTGTITCTTIPSGQTVNVSVVSVSHTSYTKNGSSITFTGKSKGTDEFDLYMVYNGKQYKKRITVNVTDPNPNITLRSIYISKQPNKTTYTVGETLDASGMVVNALYSDGSTRTIAYYTCTPTVLTNAGTQTITVACKEGGVVATTTFTVTVLRPDVHCELTLSQSSVTVPLGEEAQVRCSYTLTDNSGTVKNIVMRAHNDDSKVVSVTFGKWETGSFTHDSTPMILTPNQIGTTTIHVQVINKDTEEVLAEQALTVRVTQPNTQKVSVSLRTPSVTTLRYIDYLYLHATVENMPEGAQLIWSTDTDAIFIVNSEINKACTVKGHPGNCLTCKVCGYRNGTATVTCTVCDKNGNPLTENGRIVQDSVKLTGKNNIFMRIFWWLLLIFGKTYSE